jgi:hypothetical protein
MTAPNLAEVTPAQLARYMVGTGWLRRQKASHSSLWTTQDDGFEVLLPLDPEFRDYRARLGDALRTIASAEERDIREVVTDILAATVDSQHFRLLPDTPSGTIPLPDIVDVARGVRDLMYAAAHAATLSAPMLVQPRPRPPQVNLFVRSVRLAAPAPGSFVLSAQVPVGEGNLPFNRVVVRRLHQAVSAVHAAATEAVDRYRAEPFTDRAGDGVSANLCEAVALIGRTQPFDLRFTWAGSAPPAPGTSRFSFDRRLIRIVGAAARELPALAVRSEVVLVARVTRLARDAQGQGQVNLRGTGESGTGPIADANVIVNLPATLYDRAVVAHRDRRQVRVRGVLRGSELIQVTGFDIIDSVR